MQKTDGVSMEHARNRREYRLHELTHFSVEGYCADRNTVYEFFVFYWNGWACQPFLDFINTNVDTLAARYEQTMARLEQRTRADIRSNFSGNVNLTMLLDTPELLAHPSVCQCPLYTRYALYRDRNKDMRESETIHYVD